MTQRLSFRDLLLAICCVAITILGCTLGGSAPAPDPLAGELQAINALIDTFQTSYSQKNYAALRGTFHPKANVGIDYAGSTVQSTYRIDEWITATEQLLKDKRSVSDILSNRDITVYRNLATVVADYNYRADGEHQAGQDIMILVKMGGQWKIFSLVFYGDPVRKS